MKSACLLAVSAVLLAPVAVRAQGASGQPAAQPEAPAVQTPTVLPVDAALAKLADKNPLVRRQGVDELVRLRDPKGLPSIVKALSDEAPAVRAAAADGVGQLHLSEASKKLSELLTGDPDQQVRQSAAISMTYLGDPSTEDALLKALKDPAPGVRYASIRTLGSLRSHKAVPLLAEALKDPDANMKRVAAAALGMTGDKDGVAGLSAALSDPDAGVRLEIVKALGSIGDRSAVDALKARIEDDSPDVRLQSALALGRMGDASGAALGFELLKSPDASLRQQAAGILGMVGDKDKALPALEKAFSGEKDVSTKQMIDFARAQLKARLGVKEPPPAAVAPSTGTAAGLAPAGAAKPSKKPAPKTKKKKTK